MFREGDQNILGQRLVNPTVFFIIIKYSTSGAFSMNIVAVS